jgi:hypothetical protein
MKTTRMIALLPGVVWAANNDEAYSNKPISAAAAVAAMPVRKPRRFRLAAQPDALQV